MDCIESYVTWLSSEDLRKGTFIHNTTQEHNEKNFSAEDRPIIITRQKTFIRQLELRMEKNPVNRVQKRFLKSIPFLCAFQTDDGIDDLLIFLRKRIVV